MRWNPFRKTVEQTRDYAEGPPPVDIPEKVFIGQDGPTYEYTFDEVRMKDLFNGYYGSQNMISLFYCLPEVASAVHQIASRVADAVFQLRKTSNDEVDYKNEQFNKLFAAPNPIIQSTTNLVYQAVCYEILTGKQFFYVNAPDYYEWEFNDIVTWGNLPAEKVKITVQDTVDPYSITALSDLVVKYEVPGANGRTRVFNPDHVAPILKLNLREGIDIRKVVAPILGAEMAIKNLIPVYEARGTIYIKRGALGFLVSKKSDQSGLVSLTKSEKQEAINELNNTYGLTRRKSPVGVTSAPMEFVRTIMSISELQPFEETLADAVAIYRTLGIPRGLVPSKDQSTFANNDADMKDFYTGVIIPRAKAIADILTNFFRLDRPKSIASRRYIWPSFDHISFLQASKVEEAKVAQTMGIVWQQRFLNSVCTLNEWIVGIGNQKHANPLFDKLLLEMTPEEQDLIKTAFNIKTLSTSNTQTNEQSSSTPQDTGGQTAGNNA